MSYHRILLKKMNNFDIYLFSISFAFIFLNKVNLKYGMLTAAALCDQNWQLKFSKKSKFIFLKIYKVFLKEFLSKTLVIT